VTRRSAASQLGSWLDQAADLPPVRALRQRRFDRLFASATGMSLYRGVYASFAEAAASAPASKPLGYDSPEPARMYDERLQRVYPNDYPVLFWLARILPDVRSVFDFGGHVGVAYYAYEKYLRYPDDLQWTVLDVPAVADRGRELARERGVARLRFAGDVAQASGTDVFLAAGSLQYVEQPLHEMLARLEQRPAHVVINKLPLHAGQAFVTLQSIGTAFCPYHVFNREAFLDPLRGLGYELVDEWQNPDVGCRISVDRTRGVPAYTGLYLRSSARPSRGR